MADETLNSEEFVQSESSVPSESSESDNVYDLYSVKTGYKPNASHWQVVLDNIGRNRFVGTQMTAVELWENAIRYFQWADSHPIYKGELMKSGNKAGSLYSVPVQRPYNMAALCLHLGVTREYLYDAAKSETQNDFYFVARHIIDIMYSQKLELAIVGVYNAVMISKELGLDNGVKAGEGSSIINITVDNSSPKLIENEREIDISSREITDENGISKK